MKPISIIINLVLSFSAAIAANFEVWNEWESRQKPWEKTTKKFVV